MFISGARSLFNDLSVITLVVDVGSEPQEIPCDKGFLLEGKFLETS